MNKLHRAINETIEIGRNYSNLTVENIERNHSQMDIDFNNDMQYIIFSQFLAIHLNDKSPSRDGEYENIELTVEEMILLFKGVAIGEVYLSGGDCSGYVSVSGTIMVLHKLITMDLQKAKKVWKWTRSFGLCNDHYLPNPNDEDYIARHSDSKKEKGSTK